MHRNDANGFGPGNTFQEGAPGTGLLASRVGAKWLNAVQDELVAIVADAGLPPDDENNGQVLQALGLLFSAGNAAAVLKNRLVNGGFELWQRGTSFNLTAAINTLTADRWAGIPDATGAGTATVSRQTFAVGQTDVPDGPKYYLRWVQTVNATNAPALFQPIEDVARYSSGTITVSFWARASVALNAATKCTQIFGTGGSAAVAVGTQAIAVTTSWQRFFGTFTLPSVAGQTIGPLNYLRVGVTLPPAATYTFEISDFQVETGESATAFDRRPSQVEYLIACRYFEKSYALETAPGTVARGGALHRRAGAAGDAPAPLYNLQERFRVPKRAPPTITWYAPTGAGAPWDPGIGKISTLGGAFPFTPHAIPVNATIGTNEEWTGYPVREDFSALGEQGNFPNGPSWAQWTAEAELV